MSKNIDEKYVHSDLTSKILQAFYTVYNHFRFGFPKEVYQNALLIELGKLGLSFERQKIVKIYYENQIVGECTAEILVENNVVVNIETIENATLEDELKIHYILKTSDIEVGLFLNFGKIPYHKRKYYPNKE